MAQETPPGWYPDPTNENAQRYWDGNNWLDIPPPQAPHVTTSKKTPSKRLIVGLSIGIGAVLLIGGGAIAWKVVTDNRIAAEEEAAREAQAEEAATAAAEAEAADGLERELRAAMVIDIEESVKAMAEGHVADGVIDGPIIEVTCSPVGGGSTDDLDQSTTVFDCFVANEDNGDGTMSGYGYNSTMNWETGRYTYSLGAP